MKYLRSVFRTILISLLLIMVLIASIVIFLFTTEPGLYTLVKLANFTLPGKIRVQAPQGRLLDNAIFSKFQYEDEDIVFRMTDVHLKWQPFSLLWNQPLVIDQLQATYVLIRLKIPPQTTSKPVEIQSAFPKLPFGLKLKDLHFKKVKIEQETVVQTLSKFHLQADLLEEKWHIIQLQSNYGHFHFALTGNLLPQLPYPASASLQFDSIPPALPELHGKLNLAGDLLLYRLQGYLNGPLNGKLKGTVKKGLQVHLESTWLDAKWPLSQTSIFEIQSGQLALEGNLKNIEISGKALLKSPLQGDLQISALLQDQILTAHSNLHTQFGSVFSTISYDEQAHPKFKGEIKTQDLHMLGDDIPLREMRFDSQFNGSDAATLQAKINFSGLYRDNLLNGKISYQAPQLGAVITLGTNKLNVTGSSPYQWQANLSMPQPQILHPSLEGLRTCIQGKATIASMDKGSLNLSISSGSIQSPDDAATSLLAFQGGTFSALLSPKQLDASGMLSLDKNKILKISLNLPKYQLNQPALPTQVINGKLNLQINSLDFLQSISREIEKPEGKLSASLNVQGTIKNPTVDGNIVLTNGSVLLPKTGLTLRPIQATLQSKNKHWKLDGSIAENGKTLSFKGDGVFAPTVSGQVKVESSTFPILKTSEYSIDIAPQLAINFKPQLLEIRGTILVPKAQLNPISFSDTVDLTEDAVFVKKENPTKLPLTLLTDVEIKMGQDVALSVKGVQGFLDGAIHIKQIPQGEPFAVGELSVREGKYQAYGQKLAIEQGQLLFTGGGIDNPGIRVRAVRYFTNTDDTLNGSNQVFDFNPDNIQTTNFGEKTTVGIEISGRLKATKIKLFSIPPNLSQADILSMLILGKPANQANKSGGQLLLTAISSMNLDSGTKGLQLVNQLKQTLGVDFNFADTSQYNQKTNQISDGTAFVVGKSITSRLYLSYNIGLFQEDSNVLTLKYLLNKFFSVQVTTSNSGSGVDLLYTHAT